MYKIFSLVLAWILITIGCAHSDPYVAPPIPTKYTMVIDRSFPVPEQQLIVDGADAWAALIPDVTWTFLISDRMSIEHTLDTLAPDNTLYIIRMDDTSTIPAECVILDNGFGCYKDQRVYLPESDLVASKSMQRVTSHEVGHFFGLQHSLSINTIMGAKLSDIAYNPSASDVKLYCQYKGCPLLDKQNGLTK